MSRHETIEIVLAEGGHVGQDWEEIQEALEELLHERYALEVESVDVSTLLVADEAVEPEPANLADNALITTREGPIQIGAGPRRPNPMRIAPGAGVPALLGAMGFLLGLLAILLVLFR